MNTAPASGSPPDRSPTPPSWRDATRWAGPSAGLIVVWLLFALLNGSGFVSWSNQRLMLLQTAVVGTAALGATLVILSGAIDLSVGSTIALGTMVLASLLKMGVPPLAAAGATISSGFVLGWTIGQLVTGRVGWFAGWAAGALLAFALASRMPPWLATAAGIGTGWFASRTLERLLGPLPLSPFIVTLGMWGALRGVAKGIAGETMVVAPTTWLNDLLTALPPGGRWLVVPPGVWLTILLAVAVAVLLQTTVLGRHILATGSNESTARLCGVAVDRVKVTVYALASALAAVAGVLQYAYLTVGDPTTALGMELDIIAAVVIGGASLAGGRGSVAGTLIGALIMTAVANGCTKLELPNWVQEIVTGAIIVAAVAIDRIRRRDE